MERKFESELGKRLQEGKKRDSTINLGVMSAAFVSIAVLVGSAAFLLPAMAETGVSNGVAFSDLLEQKDDYLVDVDGALVLSADLPEGGDFDVKRVVSLKQATFSSPSTMSLAEYNKFAYSLNLNLRDIDIFVPAKSVVGSLLIPYTLTEAPIVSWSLTVNGSVLADNDIETTDVDDTLNPVSVDLVADEYGVINGIACNVTLPDMTYNEGDLIGIQVMMKVKWYTDDDVAFTEIAFLAPPVAEAGDDQTVDVGEEVVLDGSESTDYVGIVSYTWELPDGVTLDGMMVTVTFASEGIYEVTLTVEDGDGLIGEDTVLITVEALTDEVSSE